MAPVSPRHIGTLFKSLECWVPHNLRGDCLRVSRLGQYSTVQMSGQNYNELVHRQLFQDLAEPSKLCTKPQLLFVQDEYGASSMKTQRTGIRQGCPLSPYLFPVVMTCIDHDVSSKCSNRVINSRIPGVLFDTFFFNANDTILFSTKPRGLNAFLQPMEDDSEHSGLKINTGQMSLFKHVSRCCYSFPRQYTVEYSP